MRGEPHELLFLAVDHNGRNKATCDEHAIRSHVQRSISHSKRQRLHVNNVRLVQMDHGRTYVKRAPRKIEPLKRLKNTTTRSGREKSAFHAGNPFAKEDETFNASRKPLFVKHLLTVYHPFAILTARHVNLCPLRLDQLFKSDAFRLAARPLFDSRHVDACFNMLKVFPRCEEEPAFIHALAFCIVQIWNRGKYTIESLSLKARTIELLNKRLQSSERLPSAAVIGTVMLLKSVAYKFQDIQADRIHTNGLNKILHLGGYWNMTNAAVRALFWLDLFAAELVNSKRLILQSQSGMPNWIYWHRKVDNLATHNPRLPSAFDRYRDLLPTGLLGCICDVVELQAFLRIGSLVKVEKHVNRDQIDPIQASVESLLSDEAQRCTSTFAEMIRKSVFICCYCSYTETWNNTLIPCKIADKLIASLEQSLTGETDQVMDYWSDRLDALLWLLLVVSVVVSLDQGNLENLKGKQAHLIQSARQVLRFWSHEDLSSALSSSLKDFLYCDQWLSERYHNDAWLELEISIEADMIGLLPTTPSNEML